MPLGDQKKAALADILEVLVCRSGQTYVVGIDVLKDTYTPGWDEEFVDDCIEILVTGDYPVRMDRDSEVLIGDDRERGLEIIQELRGDLYF